MIFILFLTFIVCYLAFSALLKSNQSTTVKRKTATQEEAEDYDELLTAIACLISFGLTQTQADRLARSADWHGKTDTEIFKDCTKFIQ